MSVIGPLGLLVLILPPVLWLHGRVEAWIPERRRDLVIILAVFGVGLWLATLIGTVSVGQVPTWEIIVTPLLMGATGVVFGLLTMYVMLWLVDRVTGEPTQRMRDATISGLPQPMRDGFRELRGPFWSLLTPVRVIRRERERDE